MFNLKILFSNLGENLKLFYFYREYNKNLRKVKLRNLNFKLKNKGLKLIIIIDYRNKLIIDLLFLL